MRTSLRLRVLAVEVTRVTLEVGSQGMLRGQAHAACLAHQVHSIPGMTRAVAFGDLNNLMNVDVQGSMLDLKMVVNSVVAQLGMLANEVKPGGAFFHHRSIPFAFVLGVNRHLSSS